MKRKQVIFKLGELDLYKIAESKEDFSEYVKELIRRDQDINSDISGQKEDRKICDKPLTKPFLKGVSFHG